MTTVHLVYPHSERISCPDAIGRHLGERLANYYRVKLYDWFEFRRLEPSPGDVLVGHACPLPMTVFSRSCRDPRWSRVLLLSPHCHGDNYQPAFNDRALPHCDLYLAITGRFWFDSVRDSRFAHWLPKMRHVDLAVDRREYPAIKDQFEKPGSRKFLYIGSDAWYKNVEYLSAIGERLPSGPVSWIGSDTPRRGLRALGRHDFSSPAGRAVISNHDFLLTVGKADGNPSSILEAMAWGLVPVCTPQSGYQGYPGILNIPLDDLGRAIQLLNEIQGFDEGRLKQMQRLNWAALDNHFNWDRFARQVLEAIEVPSSPPLLSCRPSNRLAIRWAEITNPFIRECFNPRKLLRRLAKVTSSRRPSRVATEC